MDSFMEMLEYAKRAEYLRDEYRCSDMEHDEYKESFNRLESEFFSSLKELAEEVKRLEQGERNGN